MSLKSIKSSLVLTLSASLFFGWAETPLAAESLPLKEQIAVLRDFFSKDLKNQELLKQALPPEWLEEKEQDKNVLSELEEKLLTYKAKEKRSPKEEQELELLILQIQWLKLSPENREDIFAELRSKEISQSTDQKGERLVQEAKEENQESLATERKIEAEAKKAQSERESRLLDIRLGIEKRRQALTEAKQQLGVTQKDLSEQVKRWSQLELEVRKTVDAKGSDFVQYRKTLRELLATSNQRVKSRADFLNFYLPNLANFDINIETKPVIALEDDSQKVKDLIQDIHTKTIDLNASLDLLKKDVNLLIGQLISWERDFRDRLLITRGKIISRIKKEDLLLSNGDRAEPLFQEGRTIVSSGLFWIWSFKFVYFSSQRSSKSIFEYASDSAYLLRALLLATLALWLLFRRRIIVEKLQHFFRTKLNRFKLKWGDWLSELLKDLYAFLVLLLLGSLIIDFGKRLGFTFLEGLRPILETSLIFFFLWGITDFVSPAISQRRFRVQNNSDEVKAMEELFEFIPKLLLVFFLAGSVVDDLLFYWLNSNFIVDIWQESITWVFLVALYIGIWWKRSAWRLVAMRASDSRSWLRLLESSQGKFWEPPILLFGGGLGVYLLAWKIIKARLSEMEFAKSFQAMVSRALLERKRRNSTTRVAQDRFPDGYIECFNYEVKALPEWHVERKQPLDRLQMAYSRWSNEKEGTTVLLTGDRGVGKSELVYQFLRKGSLAAREAKLKPGNNSLQDVCNSLGRQLFGSENECSPDTFLKKIVEIEPSIVLLENLENSILRQVDGFQALSFIIDAIMRTSGRHLWIVTFTPYAWTIAKRAVPGADCFSHYIYLTGMKENELEKMILTRHQHNEKLRLDFSRLSLGEGQKKKHQNLNESEAETRRRELYFRILWDYTGGNPRQALYFWKTSLSIEKESAKVELFEVPEHSILEGLRDKTLILLSALIEHNGMTLRGLSMVLNEKEEAVRRWVEEVMPYGILYRFGNDTDFGWHVESFWIGAVESYLEKRQLLFRGGLR